MVGSFIAGPLIDKKYRSAKNCVVEKPMSILETIVIPIFDTIYRSTKA